MMAGSPAPQTFAVGEQAHMAAQAFNSTVEAHEALALCT
jgi:hypothetical protein